MKIRDAVFLVIGGLLVISGMVLNSVLVVDANADKGSIDAKFGKITCQELEVSGKSMFLGELTAVDISAYSVGTDQITCKKITCKKITIVDENGKSRGVFGLATDGSAILIIYGDDGKTKVVYLGPNTKENDEMAFQLRSKSKTDKRMASMQIDENGGRFDAFNKLGESVAFIGVGDKGGGGVDLRDKHGYKK